MQELKKHRVYREAKAVFNMKTSDDLKHTVRYYNSWFEDLTPGEIEEEEIQKERYAMRRQRLSSVDESAQSNSDSLTGNSRDKRLREIMSEESDQGPSDSEYSYDEESEAITKTGDLNSRQSIVRLMDQQKEYWSVNFFIQMEFCSGENL